MNKKISTCLANNHFGHFGMKFYQKYPPVDMGHPKSARLVKGSSSFNLLIGLTLKGAVRVEIHKSKNRTADHGRMHRTAQ